MSSLKAIALVSGRAKGKTPAGRHDLSPVLKRVPWPCLYVMEESSLDFPQSAGCLDSREECKRQDRPITNASCLCNEGDRCPVGQGWSSWQDRRICLEHASPLDKYRISILRTTCPLTLWFQTRDVSGNAGGGTNKTMTRHLSKCQQDEMCPKSAHIQQIKYTGYIIGKDKSSNIALSISNILLYFFPKRLKSFLLNG